MRYFLELSYLGTEYCGWQRQPNAPTVQGVLEQALGRLMRLPVSLVGAGRTDTGVHASYYVAHFDVPDAGDSAGEVGATGTVGEVGAPFDLYHLNAMLPRDIAVHSVRLVEPDAHARFGAREREYKYYVVLEKDPVRHATAWWYAGVLDVGAMNRAAEQLLGRQDFTTFSKLHGGNHTFICNVMQAQWVASTLQSSAIQSRPLGGVESAREANSSQSSAIQSRPLGGVESAREANSSQSSVIQSRPTGGVESASEASSSTELIFTIRADRFLRNMVRSIVGTLVDVGRGRLTPERFGEILKAQDRSLASTSAPAQGLFLSDIIY